MVNEGGEIAANSNGSISVTGADAVTLILACGTDYKMELPTFRGEDPHAAVTQRVLAAAQKGYKAVRQDHVADHSGLFSRLEISFNGDVPQVPTDELIQKYRNMVDGDGRNAPTESEQRALEVICYQFGRYLTIAGSREGALSTDGALAAGNKIILVTYGENGVTAQVAITTAAREEVAAIFYRLLTDASKDAYGTDTNRFSDVPSSRWSNRAISTLANAGIISGYPDGTFKPGQTITRAEFTVIAVRFDTVTNASNPFTDTVGHWAEKQISFAASKGWVNGYPDGTFNWGVSHNVEPLR